MRSGAMALFGEKYGDQVRVVSVGDWARELCGGTHAGSSGKLGVVKLLGESSIGSGVRRVEALVGTDAYQFLAREHVLVAQLSEALKARPEELPARVDDILEKLRAAEKELEKVRVAGLLAARRRARRRCRADRRGRRGGHRAPGAGGGDVRTLALDVRGRLPADRPGVVVVIGDADGKVSVVAAVNDEARARGVSANELVRAVGPLVGGKGGGKDDVAQGGGTDAVADRRGARAGPRRGGKGLRHGVRLGIDPGDARIGVARSDPSGFLATPVETVKRGRGDLARIAEILAGIAEDAVVLEVVVGLPRSLSGGEGPAAAKVRDCAVELARAVAPLPVRLADERLTTVGAEAMLRDRGRKGAERRAVVDQVAAVLILQHVLDTERDDGHRPRRDRREDPMTDYQTGPPTDSASFLDDDAADARPADVARSGHAAAAPAA